MDEDKANILGYELLETCKESVSSLFERHIPERKVLALIAAGADVNRTDNEGKAALFYAVQMGKHESVVRALVDGGADVNRTDNEGKTALFYAFQIRNYARVVRALIVAGTDVNRTDNEGKTALFYAVQQRNNGPVVRALVDSGADVNRTDNEGKTALIYAVQRWHNKSVVRALVIDLKMNVTAKDIFGRTPLFYAVTKSLVLASVLIEKGANLHCKDNCNVSILSFFIENCILNKYDGCLTHMKDTLTFFMENGVKRKTIFKTIISVVFCQILRVLMANNMFQNCEQAAKTLESLCEVLKSAKDYAKENKKREITDLIDEILQQMINRTIDRLESVTPNILELLIKLGANPTSADSEGNTSIHFLTRLSVVSSVSQETVHDIITKLEASEKLGNFRKLENHQQETPFVHMIYVTLNDRSAYNSGQCPLPNVATVFSVCKFLLKHGSSIEETSRTGRTAFHWILRLISQVLLRSDVQAREEALTTVMQMFELFASQNITEGVTVNQKDAGDNLNTPLHLLASLQLRPGEDYSSFAVADGFTFESILDKIVRFLLKCGAQVGSRNKDDETPLHLCRTWTAVKLLLEAGANPDDLDSSGCPPLIAVARKMTFNEDSNNFYPDLLLNPKELWETILKSGMNPWFVDENGDSVLSIFMKSKALVLTKALVEVACEKTLDLKETILKSILNSICKDESIVTTWKSDLVEVILKSQKGSSVLKPSGTSPLHNCCRNIMSLEKAKSLRGRKPKPSKLREYSRLKKATSVDSTSRKQEGIKLDKDNVHWTIAKLLLHYGADCTVPDVTGQCCMDIAEDCPALKELFQRKDIPWISVSEKHKLQLSRTAKLQECCHADQYYYHQHPVNRGSFCNVHAGINEKDGREVAIKRIKLPMNQSDKREVLKQEIATLTALERFEQVVGYFDSFEDETFVYVVLELMEGNLEEYLDSPGFDVSISVKLCQDVLTGLKFLHSQKILHQDLKPTNILYKEYPTLCLKIADFGLSYHVNCSSTVNDSGVGARCWIAPEVLTSEKPHSKASDVFSCGLVLRYILSVKKHPFASRTREPQHETEANITNGNMEGWDISLCSEATHLLKGMLDGDDNKRPSADKALVHPFFWTKKKKLDLLIAVGNQPEFECPRAKRTPPLTPVETDLETRFNTIVKYANWNDPGYVHMPAIYAEMTRKRRRYNTHSVVELVRFIRNAIAYVSDRSRSTPIRKQILEDLVFLKNFPHLVMEVFKAVTTHGWDQMREEIKYTMKK